MDSIGGKASISLDRLGKNERRFTIGDGFDFENRNLILSSSSHVYTRLTEKSNSFDGSVISILIHQPVR